jgi:hypothetical protein
MINIKVIEEYEDKYICSVVIENYNKTFKINVPKVLNNKNINLEKYILFNALKKKMSIMRV